MLLKSNPFYIYIVKCNDGTFYTGITTDFERRLRQHNGEISGGAKYTLRRGPVSCVYIEKFATRSEAARREWDIKQLDRQQKIDLIHSYRQ